MSSILEQLLIIDHNQAFGGIVSASTDFNIFWYSSSTASVAIHDMSKWKHDIKKNIQRKRLTSLKKFIMLQVKDNQVETDTCNETV